MMFPTHPGASPLFRVHMRERPQLRLSRFDPTFIDLRRALIAFVSALLVDSTNALVRRVMMQAWSGARLAQDITAAAIMLSAAGRYPEQVLLDRENAL